MRPVLLRALTPITLLLAASVLSAGCANDDDGGTERDTGSAEREAAADRVDARLELTLGEVGDKGLVGIPIPDYVRCGRSVPASCRGRVECSEDGDKDEPAVCAWLAGDDAKVLTEEPADDVACTQIYGGPETATVTGELDGEEVDATFSRSDGCEIARWDVAAPLLTGALPPDPDSAAGGNPAAGACLANAPDTVVSSEDAADAADDSSCGGSSTGVEPACEPNDSGNRTACAPSEPDEIEDPPSAFEK